MYPIVPPDHVPRRCAVIPGRTTDPEGFIVTGHVLSGFDPAIEISVTGAKELGKLVGMVPKEHVEELEARTIQMAAELATLRNKIDRLETAHTILTEVAA